MYATGVLVAKLPELASARKDRAHVTLSPTLEYITMGVKRNPLLLQQTFAPYIRNFRAGINLYIC